MAQYSFKQLEQLWVQAGGNAAYSVIAAAIAMAESSGKSDASNFNTNGTEDRGLWQINSIWGSLSTFDPMANAKAAVEISHNGTNWHPWTTYNTGAYKQYMGGQSPPPTPVGGSAGGGGGGGNPLADLFSFPSQIINFFGDANSFVNKLMWLVNPASWLRIGAFLVGVVLLLFAIHAFIAVGEGKPIVSMPQVIPVPV